MSDDVALPWFQLAARVQQARTVETILSEAASGLKSLGIALSVVRPDTTGACVLPAGPDLPAGTTLRFPEKPAFHPLAQPFLQACFECARPADLSRVAQALGVSDPSTRLIVAPLQLEQGPWGLMVLHSVELSEMQLPAAGVFAEHLSAALQSATSLQGLHRRNRELAALEAIASVRGTLTQMIPTMLEMVAQASASDAAALWLAEPSGTDLVLTGEVFGTNRPMFRSAVRFPMRAQAVKNPMGAYVPQNLSVAEHPKLMARLAENFGVQAAALVPLHLEGRPVGVIGLGRKRPQLYSGLDLHIAELLARQIAIQVEKAQVTEEAQRRLSDLMLIAEVGDAIARQLDLSAVLSMAVGNVSRIADLPTVFLMLTDDTGKALRLAASNVLGNQDEGTVIPFGTPSLATLAMQTRQPVEVNDTRNDPRPIKSLVARFRLKALMVVPLIANGNAIGALVLGDPRKRRVFSVEDKDRVLAVANQVGNAIANAQLFDDVRRSYEALSRKHAELVRHERLAAVGELAAVMAHEVRNPLGAIFNSLTSLKMILTPEGDTKLSLDILFEESERLNRIVGELLDFVRPHVVSKKTVDLQTVVESAIEVAAQSIPCPRVRITTDFPQQLPAVSADADLLRRAVINLLVNALQSMPDGGTVTVRTATETHDRRPFVARIEIQDEGPGIPAENADRIFQPFFTTKATGTGLGLAVVKRIVEDHLGMVDVRTGGQGTTFVVRLPAGT